MQLRLPTCLLSAALVLAGQARTLVFHVATNGNDGWSGELASSDATRGDGPFATPAAALRAVRAARTKQPGAFDGATILIRKGTYELGEPLVLAPEDSGADAQNPLVIAAYPDERPVLSGGRRITGWRTHGGRPNTWTVELPAVRDGRWYFRQLFVNGQRQSRARTPNTGFYRIQGPSPQDQPVRIRFKPGEIKPEWAAAGDVELVAYLAWADIRMPIRSVDPTNHVATLAGNPRPSNREDNAQFFIENAPDALDEPGEWYIDRKSGILTLRTGPGEDLARAEAVAPRLRELLRFQGDIEAQRPVHNIILRGLTFADTDWDLGPDGHADTQAAVDVRGDVVAEGAVDIAIEDCTFTRLGGYGLELGRGCQRWKVVGNDFDDLGAGGIRLGETRVRTGAFDPCQGHGITDNHLRRLGRVYPPAVGVFILQSANNRMAHNHIHDLFYTAVSVGWNWGYQETPCHDNIIEFNHLHDIGQARLSDMGAVYTLGIQKGTVIRNNLIHDVQAFTYGGWGLYTDEGSTSITLENNVVYRCKSAGFHQHYGRENVVRNNIFAASREHQLMRTRQENHISFVFERNIVYFDSGELLGGNWGGDRFVVGSNIYFDARPQARPETLRFAGASLDQWRQRGHDTNSLVADPRFLDPRQFDFRLSTNSPAFQLGFKAIDLSRVGVRPRGQRL
jgi:parallel beta-helix repeat protein